MSKFKIGDIVSLQGEVTSQASGLIYVRHHGGDISYGHTADELTLVSRPEPTYTVELTASELNALRWDLDGESGANLTGLRKLQTVINENGL